MPPAASLLAMSLLSVVVYGAAEPVRKAAPLYTTASIVNAATNQPGPLAPLALASLYGTDLAFATRGLSIDDVQNGVLPTSIIGTGVVVTIENTAVPVIFVSPGQVNFIVPGNIRKGKRKLRLAVNGRTGPEVELELADVSPGIFSADGIDALAARPDGSLVTRNYPAAPGEILILYAAGLGPTQPGFGGASIPDRAAEITARSRLLVALNGVAAPDDSILYAGVTPGFAGLYQINWRVPVDAPYNPEIRLWVGEIGSPEGIFLPVSPGVVVE